MLPLELFMENPLLISLFRFVHARSMEGPNVSSFKESEARAIIFTIKRLKDGVFSKAPIMLDVLHLVH